MKHNRFASIGLILAILGNFCRAIIQQSILIFAIRENFTFFFSNCTHQASTQYCKNQPY